MSVVCLNSRRAWPESQRDYLELEKSPRLQRALL